MVKTMTFGVMPTKKTFQAHWRKTMADRPYSYMLCSEDAESARRARVPTTGSFGEGRMYGIIKKLRDKYLKGDDDAGSLASSILSTLDFEWI